MQPNEREAIYTEPGVEASPAQVLRQSAAVDLAVDSQEATGTFTPLLSLVLTTKAGFLLIFSSWAASATLAGLGSFRLVLDGVALRGSAQTLSALATEAGALVQRVPVAAGQHTVALDWRTQVGTVLRCRPVTIPDESASLLVLEVTG